MAQAVGVRVPLPAHSKTPDVRAVFSSRLILRGFFFLFGLLWLLAPGTVWAESSLNGLSIHLVEKKKLRLVRYATGPKSPSVQGLEGALEVTLKNDSGNTVRLPKHDVHGVVFRSKSDGKPFVVVHSCQCVHDVTAPKFEGFTLLPGQTHAFTISEWGCGGGMWPSPPPGDYEVQYRSLKWIDPLVPSVAEREPTAMAQMKALVSKCGENLSSETYWKEAVSSNSLRIVLNKPVTISIGRGP